MCAECVCRSNPLPVCLLLSTRFHRRRVAVALALLEINGWRTRGEDAREVEYFWWRRWWRRRRNENAKHSLSELLSLSHSLSRSLPLAHSFRVCFSYSSEREFVNLYFCTTNASPNECVLCVDIFRSWTTKDLFEIQIASGESKAERESSKRTNEWNCCWVRKKSKTAQDARAGRRAGDRAWNAVAKQHSHATWTTTFGGTDANKHKQLLATMMFGCIGSRHNHEWAEMSDICMCTTHTMCHRRTFTLYFIWWDINCI